MLVLYRCKYNHFLKIIKLLIIKLLIKIYWTRIYRISRIDDERYDWLEENILIIKTFGPFVLLSNLFLGQQAFDICFDILGTHIIDRLKMIKLFIFFE